MVILSKKEIRQQGLGKKISSSTKTGVRLDARTPRLPIQPARDAGQKDQEELEGVLSEEGADEQEDEVSEEGMRRLMELVGEEDLDKYEKAQLAFEAEGNEDAENEEASEEDELEHGTQGVSIDGEDVEDVNGLSSDEEEKDVEVGRKVRIFPLTSALAKTGGIRRLYPLIQRRSRCHTTG